jgi:hypothetical protein
LKGVVGYAKHLSISLAPCKKGELMHHSPFLDELERFERFATKSRTIQTESRLAKGLF